MRPDGSVEAGRLREWFSRAGDAAPPPAACSGRDRIWDAALGQVTPGEMQSLLDHAAGCASCAEAWRLARQVIAGAGLGPDRRAERAPSEARIASSWTWGLAAAAAAAALALVIVAPRLLREEAPPPVFRDDGGPALAPLVPAGAALPRDAFVLRWSPGPPGSLYEVEVATEDLRPVGAARALEGSEYRLPPEALADIPSGARLLWRVEALLPDGTRVASPTFHVSLQ